MLENQHTYLSPFIHVYIYKGESGTCVGGCSIKLLLGNWTGASWDVGKWTSLYILGLVQVPVWYEC